MFLFSTKHLFIMITNYSYVDNEQIPCCHSTEIKGKF